MRRHGIILAVGTAMALVLGAPVGASEWLYKEEVVYSSQHDPSRVSLNDGHVLEITYDGITFNEMGKWKYGRKVLVAYRPETGAVLLDPSTAKYISINRSTRNHPIDLIWWKDAREARNTIEEVQARTKGRQLWDKELNRVYKLLLGDSRWRKFTKEEKDVLINSQRKWIQFRNAQLLSIEAFYGKRTGIIQRIHSARQGLELTRGQTLFLSNFLAD